MRPGEPRRLGAWPLLLALGLHVGALSLAIVSGPPIQSSIRQAAYLADEVLEVDLVSPRTADTPAKPRIQTASPTPDTRGAPPRSGSPGAVEKADHIAQSTPDTLAPPATPQASLLTQEETSDDAPPDPNAWYLKSDPSPAGSLDELIGLKPGTVTLPSEPHVSETEAAQDRVERSLAQALVERDRRLGVSRHAYLATAIDQAAMGVAPPRSTATFLVTLDGSGAVTYFAATSANRNLAQWQKVANRARAALKGKRLATGTGRPIQLSLKSESNVELPSGRAPGTGVSLLGIPLKPKENKDSGEIALLTPKLEFRSAEEPESDQPGRRPQLPGVMLRLPLLDINGDLVDVGAVGRQVVHTRIIKQRVL